MQYSFDGPDLILQTWIKNGVKKGTMPIWKMFLLGILAGIYIGFGAHVFILATSVGDTAFEQMIAKLIGASLFPVGLMMVVLCGAELFTGNNLLTLAVMDRKLNVFHLLKNWIVVYCANLAGSVFLAYLLSQSGLYAEVTMAKAIAIASSKVIAPPEQLFVKGMLCNILVVLACWLQAGAKNMIGKIFSIWFPIMLFVFAGFEHSVANMTYIPLGIFLGADVSVQQFFIGNLLPVTLGNIAGGALLIPCIYYPVYRVAKEKKTQIRKKTRKL